MCEFKVYLNGDRVMEDVIYAEVSEGHVVLRDVIGDSKTFEGVAIVEVNVLATRLVLERI